ncbi:MAG: sugar-binding transcriptional regulator [Chloroflexaceae bacterium]|jgi:DNA-binding transcriptional regulator LsrR (DeoR family)|nr:sugar-binding transcriptional regulator [Chloroflexaceae bacterium]
MVDEREELLAQVATLYYHHDRSQQEIADQCGLSRSNVSRLLKEARDRGIVEIYIRHPLRRDVELEDRLRLRFRLREVGVVPAANGNHELTIARAATLAARMLDSELDGMRVLGISWGTTVNAIVNAFAPRRRYDVEVVQMMGGVGPTDPAIDGPALVQRLAAPLTNRYRYLHAPLIVDSAEVAAGLLAQRNVAETMAVARAADVALVGIGALLPDVSSLLRAGYLSPEEFEAIRARGAVGDICARHFDSQGQQVAPEIDDRLISVTLDDLKEIPTVIGAACTPAKAPAMLAALRGGYLDILVTDSAAAEALLALA